MGRKRVIFYSVLDRLGHGFTCWPSGITVVELLACSLRQFCPGREHSPRQFKGMAERVAMHGWIGCGGGEVCKRWEFSLPR